MPFVHLHRLMCVWAMSLRELYRLDWMMWCDERHTLTVRTTEQRCNKLYDRHHRYTRQIRGRHDNIVFSSNVYVTSQPPVGHVTLQYPSSPAADDASTYIGQGVVSVYIALLC